MRQHERVRLLYSAMAELGGEGVVLGVDEVVRAWSAGPRPCAPSSCPIILIIWGLNDSKQLSPAKRELLAAQISEVARAIGCI